MSTLIEKILAGDEKAVRDFYTLYSPKILTYLIKHLPHTEDAQEICNDVFLEALDSVVFLRFQKNLLQWLYRIAHNKTVDFYRKRKVKSLLLSQVPFLEIVEKEINQPEFQFEKNKIRDRIEKTLKSLSQKYQDILNLHYEEKIPVKELATVFNLSFKATESLLFRARQSFKKTYERT